MLSISIFHKVLLAFHYTVLMRFSSPEMQIFFWAPPQTYWRSLQRSPDPLLVGRGELHPSCRPFGPCTQHTHILFQSAAYGRAWFRCSNSRRMRLSLLD